MISVVRLLCQNMGVFYSYDLIELITQMAGF